MNNEIEISEPYPVSEGEEYTVYIDAVGVKGDGICKIQGLVVIVPGAKADTTVKIKITAVKKKVAFAKIISG